MKVWGWGKTPEDADPWDRPEQENKLSENPAQEDETSADSLDLGARIAGAVMTLVSYGILFRMPDEMTWFSFGTFFLSVILFSIGLYLVVMDMPKPDTKAGVVLRNMGICAASAGVLAGAVWFVLRRNGSEGSICAATALMIQCIVFLMGLDESWQNSKAATYAFRAASIGLAVYAVWLFVRAVLSESGGEDGLLAAGTLLLIAAVVIFDTFGKRVEKQTRIVKRKGRNRQKGADGMEKEMLVE